MAGASMLPVESDGSVCRTERRLDHAQKARTYQQTQFSLGFLGVDDPSVLEGGLDDVFSDANIVASIPDSIQPTRCRARVSSTTPSSIARARTTKAISRRR